MSEEVIDQLRKLLEDHIDSPNLNISFIIVELIDSGFPRKNMWFISIKLDI